MVMMMVMMMTMTMMIIMMMSMMMMMRMMMMMVMMMMDYNSMVLYFMVDNFLLKKGDKNLFQTLLNKIDVLFQTSY